MFWRFKAAIYHFDYLKWDRIVSASDAPFHDEAKMVAKVVALADFAANRKLGSVLDVDGAHLVHPAEQHHPLRQTLHHLFRIDIQHFHRLIDSDSMPEFLEPGTL